MSLTSIPTLRSCSSVYSLKKTRTPRSHHSRASLLLEHGGRGVATSSNMFVESFTTNLYHRGLDAPPIIVRTENEKSSGPTWKQDLRLPTVILNYENDDGQTLKTLRCRKNRMVHDMLESLRITLQSFQELKELKFEFCNLQDEFIPEILKILKDNANITSLSLRGNTLRNFQHPLLRGTNLKFLDLQLCGIDSLGASELAEQLAENETLLALNVSSNGAIGDEGGIRALADALRANRTLLAINIADNGIGEVGLVYFLHVFRRFPLRQSEIERRRRINFDYLLKRDALIEEFAGNRNSTARSASNQSKKSSESSVKRKRSGTKSDLWAKKSTNASSSTSTKSVKLEQLLEKELAKSRHPFVTDSIPENHEIYCSGNNSLMHLNISYNLITDKVLEELADTVKYQKSISQLAGINNISSCKGLSRVVMEGKLPNCGISSLKEIKSLIGNHRSSAIIGSSGKRPSSARNLI